MGELCRPCNTSVVSGTVPVDVVPTAPTDAVAQRLLDALHVELGDRLLSTEIQRNEIYVRVALADWVGACRAAKRSGFDYFCFLSGLDWLDNPDQTTRYENVWGDVEDIDPVVAADSPADEAPVPEPVAAEPPAAGRRTGLAGGESRFQVFARFTSSQEHRGVVIKADLDDADPTVPTIVGVYAGANWHERETWEMYGFWFDGHPGLSHLYLPGSFEGYPLRKDFPLLAREVKPWPGLINVEPIAGDGDVGEGAEA